ncbi:hypothetical protein, partial [Thiolapillus sp.]|uniref:hypothetical protein n=1 Tax=Thiolapillus sp. TaxID=2017437 RepID=UPI003AF59DB0
RRKSAQGQVGKTGVDSWALTVRQTPGVLHVDILIGCRLYCAIQEAKEKAACVLPFLGAGQEGDQ